MALEANKAMHEGWDDTSKRLIAEYNARVAREEQIQGEIKEIEEQSNSFYLKQRDQIHAMERELRKCNPELGAAIEQQERQMRANKVAIQERLRELRGEYSMSVRAREEVLRPQIVEAEGQWKRSHQAMNEDMNRLAAQAMAAEAAARAANAAQTRAASTPSLHRLPR